MELEKYFDHTVLKPDASADDVKKVCREALKYGFASVCVNLYRTREAAELLAGSPVKVCTVIGFPLGAVNTAVKVFETEEAVRDGAEEIDMVLNIGALKDGNYDVVRSDIAAVKQVCGTKALLKVIIETCLLTEEEKQKACVLSAEAGADFLKTSTGFSTGGATAEDIRLMKKAVNGKALIKASGGIRDYKKADEMLKAGADRLGTSATLSILEGSRRAVNTLPHITTVVFDIGMVLAEFPWRSYLEAFGFSKETRERIAKATFAGLNWREIDRGAKTDEEIYAACLNEIPDLEKELAKVWEGRTHIVKEYDYAAGWVQNLKAQGYRVYLLSNYGRTTFAEAEKSFEFLKHVDGKVISYEIKKIKPEPEIYEELIRRFAICPEETVFLDDLKENVDAAKQLGFHTIQFTGREAGVRGLLSLGIDVERGADA